MDVNEVLRFVISLVPNWYQAEGGDNEYEMTCTYNGQFYTERFFSHRRLTPNLTNFKTQALMLLPSLLEKSVGLSTFFAYEMIQEQLAELWLNLNKPEINWAKFLSYNRYLDSRTNENANVAINLLVREGEGSFEINDQNYSKLIDPLASSLNVYFEVGYELQFRNYNNILWDDVADGEAYKLLPEFLHPFHHIKQANDWSVHKTSRGDFIILDVDGLVATRRKGKWTLYETRTLKNSMVDVLGGGNYWVACNLFELTFDLSYRRHGALLVYDPMQQVLPYISNRESILEVTNTNIDPVRRALMDSVANISLESTHPRDIKKRLLIELASMDGALIFNNDRILAFGAMIQGHPQVGAAVGARTTAAKSAYLYGGIPLKVSSDGDMTLYFRSQGGNNNPTSAELSFL